MPSFTTEPGNTLFLIVCAAPPASDVINRIKGEQAKGWDVWVTSTPAAFDWIDVAAVEAVTGHEVRHQFRHPTDPGLDQLGNALLVAPATFNTINKCAAGINDTLALGLLNEALGRGVPVTIEPCVNTALGSHPSYRRSIELLESLGAKILTPPTAS